MQRKTFTRLLSSAAFILLVISASAIVYVSTAAAPVPAASIIFTPVADAYVLETSPDRNHGTGPSLRVDNSPVIRSYLRFSINGLSGSTVQSVKLRIYSYSSNRTGFTVSSVAANSWDENTITYNNSPAVGNALADTQAVAGGTWTEVDLTNYIQADGTYDLALTTNSVTNTHFASRESGGNAPQLVIITDAPTIPTLTPTLGLVDTPTSIPTLVSVDTSTPIPTLVSIDTDTPTPSPTLSLVDTSTPVPTLVSIDTPTPVATAIIPSPTLTPIVTATAMDTPTAMPTDTAIAMPTSTPVSVPGSIKHVFLVVMENHSYKEVWNSSSTPFTTTLAHTYTWAANYFAITHPSLPNYLNLYGGDNYGITTDCSPSSSCHVNAVNLADNLETNGLTWKGYMESMPSPCYLSGSGTYVPRHNPFIYFDDIRTNPTRCASHVVPYSVFSADLASAATTPNYSMIVPNLCNDTHDCTIAAGDIWLKNNIPSILNSPACTTDTCLLILTWDEDDGSQNNQVLTIFAGSGAKTGGVASPARYNHFSLLRTVENIFGLPAQTGNDAAASPMSDLLR